MTLVSHMGTLKRSVSPCFTIDRSHFDIYQSNILMSNDTPPHACLADFGFMSVVPDPSQKSRSIRLESGAMTFMSPELLIPEEFGRKCAEPTPQSDIYAFGLVIFQVCRQDYRYLPLSCLLFPGPHRRNPVLWYSAIGTGVPRTSWGAPGKARERFSHRVFRFAVGFYSTLLGWRGGIATGGRGSCDTPWGSSCRLGWG